MDKNGNIDKETPDDHGVPVVDLTVESKPEPKVETEDDRSTIADK